MKAQFTKLVLVALAMLPLTTGAANAQALGGFFGQQAKTLVQQTEGAASGVGTVDLLHPAQIPGQIQSNVQTAVSQVKTQTEQTGLGDAQGALGAVQGKLAQLQSQVSGSGNGSSTPN
jgi:hypothetical protein